MFENTPIEFRDSLKIKLDSLPGTPGVYLHKNQQGEIIYVGKAISLKNRVRQYFQSLNNQQPKVVAMVRNIVDFDYILTDTEAEALTLESNLIKQYQPRYNILLKDDKHFPYVRINTHEDFPRVEIVRSLRKDHARYFGPFLSKAALTTAIEAVRENLPLRTCKKDLKKSIARGERPCLNYYIDRCIAPCQGNVSREEYHRYVDEVISFLNGDTHDIIKRLETEMYQASSELAFERAGLLKQRIEAIRLIGEKQKAITSKIEEYDIFALYQEENETLVYAFFMRAGKTIGAEPYELTAQGETAADAMSSFLKQFYSQSGSIPKKIVVNQIPSDLDAIEEWLSQLRGSKVEIYTPQRGDKAKLLNTAFTNAKDQIERKKLAHQKKWESGEGAVEQLCQLLNVAPDELPRRIEAFDISHTSGTDPVASMVVFINGQPAKKQYRRFRLKTVENDDYAAMQEVLTRRFTRGIEERKQGKTDGFADLPNMVLIDGGKGQLSSAMEIMERVGMPLDEMIVFALAERLEEVFLPDQKNSIILPSGSASLHLLQRIRDEAHRFAIQYHRSLRQKTSLYSILDDIPNIGPKRKKILFEHFISLDAIEKATQEELQNVQGIDIRSAEAVYSYFHKE